MYGRCLLWFAPNDISSPVYNKGKWLSRVPTLCDPVNCILPGSSVHEILQARVLEWVLISFSRGSSLPRDRTRVSCIPGRRFNLWATREALSFLSVQFSSVQSLSRVWLFATPWILSLVDIKSFCICGCAFFFLNVLSFCFLGLKSKTVPDSSLFYAQCLAHNRNSINTCHKTVYYSLSSSGMMIFIFFRFLHSLSYSLVPSSKICEWEVLSAA